MALWPTHTTLATVTLLFGYIFPRVHKNCKEVTAYNLQTWQNLWSVL